MAGKKVFTHTPFFVPAPLAPLTTMCVAVRIT
jgi:hypothetical protein